MNIEFINLLKVSISFMVVFISFSLMPIYLLYKNKIRKKISILPVFAFCLILFWKFIVVYGNFNAIGQFEILDDFSPLLDSLGVLMLTVFLILNWKNVPKYLVIVIPVFLSMFIIFQFAQLHIISSVSGMITILSAFLTFMYGIVDRKKERLRR